MTVCQPAGCWSGCLIAPHKEIGCLVHVVTRHHGALLHGLATQLPTCCWFGLADTPVQLVHTVCGTPVPVPASCLLCSILLCSASLHIECNRHVGVHTAVAGPAVQLYLQQAKGVEFLVHVVTRHHHDTALLHGLATELPQLAVGAVQQTLNCSLFEVEGSSAVGTHSLWLSRPPSSLMPFRLAQVCSAC